jgi:outer membrane protein assembly factor BamD (BamD/ComL family)
MNFVKLLLLTILLQACGSSNEKLGILEAEKNALEITVDSLQRQIATLKKNPADLLADARNNIKQGNFQTARHTLIRIMAHQLRSGPLKEINKLLSVVNNKLEEKDFKNLSSADTSLYRSFINNFPKSKYANTIKKRLKKVSVQPTIIISHNSTQETNFNRSRYKQKRHIRQLWHNQNWRYLL